MNKRQKIVQQAFINNEEAIIKRLKTVYGQSLKDIEKKAQTLHEEFETLKAEYDFVEDEAEREVLKSRMQSKVYQKQYQESLKKQVGDILDKMQEKEFTTVSDYLNKCYEEGFVGTMYDLQGQGIPLCFPLDQEAMVRAVQLDSKISQGLYSRLGEDVSLLKKKITAQVSRGIATGMSFQQVAQQLSGYTNIGFNNAVRIARTEGHRIQVQSGMDACYKAKEKGADVVKQWDSTLDARTRDSHAQVDGEIKELDEKFSNGLRFPGDPSGGAAEVVNCRCALLQRARWAVGGSFTKMNNEAKEIVSFKDIDDYGEFKKTYLKHAEQLTNSDNGGIIKTPKMSSDDNYNKILDTLQKKSVEYKPVENHTKQLSQEEIITALSGGDMTSGSCASVGLAYIGQKQGWNILDFRDGESRKTFASSFNLHTLSQMKGIKALKAEGASSLTVGNRLLKQCEVGKEYYLCVGRHASIVRKTPEGILQYLELQSRDRSGWTNFDKNPRYTLNHRFGCTSTSSSSSYWDFMIDIDDSDFSSADDFKSLLGYINTATDKQRKGSHGTIK